MTVILPTYNKAKYLERTLASWLHQRAVNYEIIVVDDGSADTTPAVLERYARRLPIRVIRTENGGRARARNRALQLARGRVIVFSDDDRVVHPDFVRMHAACHESSGEWVVIGGQYGLVSEVRPDETLAHDLVLRLARQSPAWQRALEAGEAFDTFASSDIEQDLSRVVELLRTSEAAFERVMGAAAALGGDLSTCSLAWMFGATGNLSVVRAAIERAGRFDERFTGWGVEDTELHYRLAQQGLRTRIQPLAINYHQNHPRDRRAEATSFNANARRFFAKHQSLEVALFVLVAHLRMSVVEAEAVLREARSVERSVLRAQYQTLLYQDVLELLSKPVA